MSQQLELILEKAFEEFHTLLKSRGQIAITFPFYRTQSKENLFVISSNFVDKLKKIGYDVVCYIPPELVTNLEARQHIERRNSLLYAREDQVVGREIFVFRKLV